MKTLLCAAAVLAILASPCSAERRYDHALEKAAANIAAAKMGDLRGGFSYKQKPQFVVAPAIFAPAPVSNGSSSEAIGIVQRGSGSIVELPSLPAPF